MFETPSSGLYESIYLPLAVVAAGVGILFVSCWAAFTSGALSNRRLPYQVKPYLFTKAEWHFHRALASGLGKDFHVFCYVRMADVLRVKGITRRDRSWRKHFYKISSKHLDFIVCGRERGEILCALELDDRSHRRRDRRTRDAFVDKACASAGLPLIRIPAELSYNPDSLRDKVTKAIAGVKA